MDSGHWCEWIHHMLDKERHRRQKTISRETGGDHDAGNPVRVDPRANIVRLPAWSVVEVGTSSGM